MKRILEIGIIMLFVSFIFGCTSEKTYDVTFVVGDQAENVIYQISENTTINETPEPLDNNHLFLGWYADSTFNELFYFNQAITENTTIYARYSIYELGKENYIAFEQNNKWGFMLPTGEVVVEAKYDHVEPFRYGYALVVEGDKFSFINPIGEEFDYWFDYNQVAYSGNIQFSSDSLAKVYVDKNVTKIINTKGETVYEASLFIPFEAYYEDGLIPAYLYDDSNERTDECVYLNTEGEIALQGNYHNCSSFNNGLAKVEIDSKVVFINLSGEVVIDGNYSAAYEMFDGIKPVYFNEGYAIVKTYASTTDPSITSKYLIINCEGNEIAEFNPDIDIPIYVIDGYILTKNSNDQVAIYDFLGDKILDYQYYLGGYPAIGIFENKIVVKDEDGMYGVIDVTTGNLMIDFQYEYIAGFKDGFSIAKKNGMYGIINQNNSIIVDFEYSNLESVYHIFMY